MGAIELEALRKRARAAGVDPGALVRAARSQARERAAFLAGDTIADRDGRLRVRPQRRADKLVEPAKHDFADARWVVAYVGPSHVREVADDLAELGFRAYVPLGRKIVFRSRVRRNASAAEERRARREVNFPVFGGYLFVGQTDQPLTKLSHAKIAEVLSSSAGPIEVRAAALKAINDAECAGKWDLARLRPRDVTLFRPKTKVLVKGGALQGFFAIVESIERSGRVRIMANMFGGNTIARVEPSNLELA